MKRTLAVFALLGVLLLCLTACGGVDITGTWESKSGSMLQFKSDGTAIAGTATYMYEIDKDKTLVIDTQNGRQPDRFTWDGQTQYKQGQEATWGTDGKTLRMGKNMYTKA